MNKTMEWLTMAAAFEAMQTQRFPRPYAIDGHRSCISKQAQADRKKRNKAAARARKRNRG